MTPPHERQTFEIIWYGYFPSDIIGIDRVKRYDLTDAITAACNMLRKGRGNAASAHGFYVRVAP